MIDVALMMALPHIARSEGLVLEPYQDGGGVWTVCYGHTQGAKPDSTWTKRECDALLFAEAAQAQRWVKRCSGGRALQPHQEAALISWVYNVGPTQACRSTLMRRLKAGLPASRWCAQLKRWVYDNGQKVDGLIARREREYKICTGATNAHDR